MTVAVKHTNAYVGKPARYDTVVCVNKANICNFRLYENV